MKPESPSTRRTWRELVEAGVQDDGYEPWQLWLLPIHLRSRIQYYREAVDKVKNDIQDLWSRVSGFYDSVEPFMKSHVVDHVWARNSPMWWGLNDIIGYIDIRLCVRSLELQASLFLTRKRVSRQLADKRFVHRRRDTIRIKAGDSNESLRAGLIAAVEELSHDPRLKRRYLDLGPWEQLVMNTDLVGLFRAAAVADENTRSTKQ